VLKGRNPWIRGPLTSADIALADRIYAKQVAAIADGPRQVSELAQLLGII